MLLLVLAAGLAHAADAPLLELAPVDAAAVRMTTKSAGGGPVQFAQPREVAVTPDDARRWQVLSDGSRRWSLWVRVPGATDLNLGFDRFRLSPGARLELSPSTDGPALQFDASHNRAHGQLWTPVLPGDRVLITLTIPAHESFSSELRLARVNGGFLDAHGLRGPRGFKTLGSCNNDVACEQADPWRDEIRSVATYSIDGIRLCTGTLLNDAEHSGTPWFLTAHHCNVTAGNAASLVTYWNFQSESCGDLSGGRLDQTVSGATWVAGRSDVDFTLLRLDRTPPPAYGVHYAGWDRSGLAPQGSVAIHHPGAEVKSISFNEDPLTSGASCIRAGMADELTHWFVDDWESGTTERGSSGSGLWDPDTHRLVGVLSGGTASCTQPEGYDCYGQFAVAWDGPAPESRLRDWLDPLDSAVTDVPGTEGPMLFGSGFELE